MLNYITRPVPLALSAGGASVLLMTTEYGFLFVIIGLSALFVSALGK